MLPDDVRRTNCWMYYHREDYNWFKQEQTQGIDAVYMGRAHGAVSKIEVSHRPSRVEKSSTTKATAVQSQDDYPANAKKSKEGYQRCNPSFEKMTASAEVLEGVNLTIGTVNLVLKQANAGSKPKSKRARARRGKSNAPQE